MVWEGINMVVARLEFVVLYDFLTSSVLFALDSSISSWNLFVLYVVDSVVYTKSIACAYPSSTLSPTK